MIKSIELNVKEALTLKTISFMQGDGANITIQASILNGTDKWPIDTNKFDIVTLEGQTSGKHSVSIRSDTISSNIVTFNLTKNESEEPGDMKLVVRFTDSKDPDRTLSTFPFIAKVIENPSYTAAEEKDNVSSLTEYVAEAKKYADSVKDVASQAKEAVEASNTAKEKAEEASTSEKNALDSATAAGESEKNALNYMNAAKDYADNASTAAATAADDTKALLAQYAESAGNSADSAGTSKTNADLSAKIAQSYSVGGSGIRDGEDTDNSKYYKEQAEMSASEASRLLEDTRVEHTGAIEDIVSKKQDVLESIDNATSGKLAEFHMDLETGHLLYTGGAFNFKVNDNGHLNWEVAI